MSSPFNRGKRKLGRIRRWTPIFVALITLLTLWNFQRDLITIRKEFRRHAAKQQEALTSTAFPWRFTQIPKELRRVPFGEDTGLVVDAKPISIRGVSAPYNASLVEEGDGYLIFFRYDVLSVHGPYPFFTYIGCAELDKDFQQTAKEFWTVNTQSDYSEDPRAIRMDDQLYIVYNDLLPHNCYCRTMRIGQLDANREKLTYTSILDPHIHEVEKNWPPFVYSNQGKSEVHFQYHFNPHKILRLANPASNQLDHLTFAHNPCLKNIPWPKKWGSLKGGTPARLIDGEYLAFFHSTFTDAEDIIWYLMGAYTFAAKPPFQITSVSQAPILFKNIYDTPAIETAPVQSRVIFPAGFCLGKKDGKEVIHVSCGENDSAIKVVTLDKKALLKSLRRC